MAKTTAASGAMTASDRLSPILIREIQQMVKSKVFLAITALMLLAILLAAILFATQSASHINFDGQDAFLITLVVLAPILLFIVPYNAFSSMRQEVTSGTSELLFLSKLTPWQIVRGKLQSSVVLLMLYLSVFAPLMAMTFFLRGVTVPDIAITLGLGIELSLLGVSIALMLGAFCRYPIVATFLRGFVALAFAVGTMFMWAFFADRYEFSWFLRSGIYFWQFHVLYSAICIFGLILFSQCAASLLAHPFENRSTELRVLAAFGTVLTFALTALLVERNYWNDAGCIICIAAVIGLTPFFLFSTSEASGFSPRTRLQVPASRLLAFLSLPFLPGGGRGLLFSLLLTFICAGSVALLYTYSTSSRRFTSHIEEMTLITAAFVIWSLVFTLGSSVLRSCLPKTIKFNWVARIIWPLAYGIIHFVIALVISSSRTYRADHDLQVFYCVFGGVLTAILLLCSIPRMYYSRKETMAAAEDRRRKRVKKKVGRHAG